MQVTPVAFPLGRAMLATTLSSGSQAATSMGMVSLACLAALTPWSPATNGEVTADVIAVPTLHDEKDFEQWKGNLAGKIILYGDDPKINPNAETLQEHYDQAKLEHGKEADRTGPDNNRIGLYRRAGACALRL